jgi:uncharacterized protein (TIGR03086 family)
MMNRESFNVMARRGYAVKTSENLYPAVAKGFERALVSVGPDQWTLGTPCEEWDVRHLVRHVVVTHRRVYALLDETTNTTLGEDVDLMEEWRSATGAVLGALASPALANTLVKSRNGERPFGALVGGLLTIDTLCHTWDLARAIGADEELDATAVDNAYAALSAVGDLIRVPGGYGPAVEAALDADPQTRFLNFAGRRP